MTKLVINETQLRQAIHLYNALSVVLWADDQPDVDVLRTLSDAAWMQLSETVSKSPVA